MQQENNETIIDAHLKGVSLRLLWSMIICTVVACCTILGVYYNFRQIVTDQNTRMNKDIEFIKYRLDKLENGK